MTQSVSFNEPNQLFTEDMLQHIAVSNYYQELDRVKREERKDITIEEAQAEQQSQKFDAIMEIDKQYQGALSMNSEGIGTTDLYKQKYKYNHDYAHFESNEQKFANMINIIKEEQQEGSTQMVSVEDIRKRSKEAGVELKQNKPITETALNYYIKQELKRQDLARKLAWFEENPQDFSAWQDAKLAWANVSGSVGALELAITAALCWAMAPLTGAAVAGVANTAKNTAAGLDVLSGMQMARMAMSAQKARTTLNTAATVRSVLNESSFATKLGYDVARFSGRMGAGAGFTAASVPSTASVFAIDGAITTVPIALTEQGLNMAAGEDFSLKDTVAEVGLGAVIGGGSVLGAKGAGKALATMGKATSTGIGKVASIVEEKIAEKYVNDITTNYMKGRTAIADELEKEEIATNKLFKEVTEIAGGIEPASEEVVDSFTTLAAVNPASKEEGDLMMMLGVAAAMSGDSNYLTKKIPWEGIWLSKVGFAAHNVANFAKDATDYLDKPASEFLDMMKANGADIQMKNPSHGFMYRVHTNAATGLKGELEKLFLKALNKDDAMNIYKAVYTAKFHPDESIRALAEQEINTNVAKLQQAYDKLQNIIEVYKNISKSNQAVREARKMEAIGQVPERASSELPYFSSSKQKKAYTFTRNQLNPVTGKLEQTTKAGSLEDAVKDFLWHNIPDKDQRRYLEIEANGFMTEDDKIFKQEIDNAIQEQANRLIHSKVTNYPDGGRSEDWNFTLLKGNKSQTGFVESILKDIKEGIDDFRNYDNMHERFLNDSNVKEMQEAMNNDISLEVYDHQIEEPFEGARLTIKDMLDGSESNMQRYTNAQQNFKDKIKESPAFQVIDDVFNSMSSKVGRKMEDAGRIFLYSMHKSLAGCEKILNADWGKIRLTAIEKVQALMTTPEGTPVSEIREVLTSKREDVKSALRSAIGEVAGTPLSVSDNEIGAELSKAVDGLIDQAIDDIEKTMTPSAKPLDIDFEAPLPKAETETEITVGVETGTDEIEDLDALLKPLMKKIGDAIIKQQTTNIMTMTNLVQDVEDCIKNPGVIPSTLLSKITSEAASPVTGVGASIEAVSDINRHLADFYKLCGSKTSANSGTNGVTRSLESYARDQKNWPEIERAIAVETICQTIDDVNERAALRKTISPDALKVATFKLDKDAQLQGRLFSVGSNKLNVGSIQSNRKLSCASNYFTGNALEGKIATSMREIYATSKNMTDKLRAMFAEWEPRDVGGVSKKDIGYANLGYHFLETLDCTRHFSFGEKYKVDLNLMREALTSKESFDKLFELHSVEDIERAMSAITKGMHGGAERDELGLVKRLHHNQKSIDEASKRNASRFLEDTKQKLYYRDNMTMLDDLKYFGHDTLDDMLRSDWEGAMKAYTILRKAGAEPYDYYHGLYQILKEHVNEKVVKEAVLKGGKRAGEVQKLEHDMNSKTFLAQLDYAINTVCGTGSMDIRPQYRIWQAIKSAVSTPMLMAAGVKSFADINNQIHTLINMGMMSGLDVGKAARVYKTAAQMYLPGGEKLRRALGLQVASRMDSFADRLLGTGTAEYQRNIGLSRGAINPLSENAGIMRFEKGIANVADVIANKMAWIGPMTDRNRSAAALTMMMNLAEVSPTIFRDLEKEQAQILRTSLGRYNINQYEWENIYSQKCIMKFNDWLKMKGTPDDYIADLGEMSLFFADAIDNLTDDEVATALKAQGKRVSPENIEQYRYDLSDKAHAMINATANEMTTLPTARIGAKLSLGYDRTSGPGVAMDTVMQFQSYNFAAASYHRDRAIANWAKPDDPLWTGLLSEMFTPSGVKRVMPYLFSTAIAQNIIEQGLGFATGKREKFTDDGGIRWEYALGHCVGEQLIGAWGGWTGLSAKAVSEAKSKGNISFQVAPAAQVLIREPQRWIEPLTREKVENKSVGVGAAMAETFFRQTGMAGFVPTKAFYLNVVQDNLNFWQLGGSEYWEKKRRDDKRYDRGIVELLR